MITLGKGTDLTSNSPAEIIGLSTDTKPLKLSDVNETLPAKAIPNGSAFIEMDTGTIYFFDESDSVWRAF